MAALLAHTRALDLAAERPTHAECVVERRRRKLTTPGWDNGREQMTAVTCMNIGYVAVETERPNFVIYRSRWGSVPEDPACMYAVIRVGLMGGTHSEPYPTRGEARCGARAAPSPTPTQPLAPTPDASLLSPLRHRSHGS